MGVFVTIERWGKNAPVLKTVRIIQDNGIEIRIPFEEFMDRVVEEIGYGVIVTLSPAQLNKRIKESSDILEKKIKSATVTVADSIH